MYTVRLEDQQTGPETIKPGPLGQGIDHPDAPAPWVAASETLPDCTEDQPPVDDIEEALMESFPCSDPPSHGVCHA
jgi:hypothetical protein